MSVCDCIYVYDVDHVYHKGTTLLNHPSLGDTIYCTVMWITLSSGDLDSTYLHRKVYIMSLYQDVLTPFTELLIGPQKKCQCPDASWPALASTKSDLILYSYHWEWQIVFCPWHGMAHMELLTSVANLSRINSKFTYDAQRLQFKQIWVSEWQSGPRWSSIKLGCSSSCIDTSTIPTGNASSGAWGARLFVFANLYMQLM